MNIISKKLQLRLRRYHHTQSLKLEKKQNIYNLDMYHEQFEDFSLQVTRDFYINLDFIQPDCNFSIYFFLLI